MFQNIDFTASTDIVVQLSNVPNTDIHRECTVVAVTTDFVQKEIRLQVIVSHYTLNQANAKIPVAEIPPYSYTMIADEATKVDADGTINSNGTIGEYTWISTVLDNKLLSPRQIITAAIQRQDAAGLIKPR